MAEHAPTVPRFDKTTFAIWCEDGPDAKHLRDEHLEGHLYHVEKNHERYIVAGPLRPSDKMALNGSFFIVIAEDEQDAMALMNGDPYISSGMYEKVTIRIFTPAVGQFIGGVTWDSVEAVKQFATTGRPAAQKA